MPYRTFLPDGAPTWLQDDNGGAWLQAFGLALDEQIDFIKQAIQARMPLIAPVDALGSIGAERQIDRAFFGDTDAEYRQRLFDAWETWTLAGTALGLLRALDDVNYVFTAEQRNFLEFSLDVNRNLVRVDRGYLWEFGFPAGFWSIFSVVMKTADIPAHWTSIVDPPTDVSAPTKAEVNFLRGIIRKWKPAKAVLDRIIVITSGIIWGFPVTRVWGPATPWVWGGTTVDWDANATP
jgi:hypothetical protein